jgi:hypothetical protein
VEAQAGMDLTHRLDLKKAETEMDLIVKTISGEAKVDDDDE